MNELSDSDRLDRLEIVSLKLGRAIASLSGVLLERADIQSSTSEREHVLAAFQDLHDALGLLSERNGDGG